MKNVTKMAAQGDLLFIKVNEIPKGFTPTDDNIVGHSETGHHHIAEGNFQRYANSDDVMRSFIVAKDDVQINHMRSWDTHESLNLLNNGGETIWEIKRQREYTPEGWRKVED